MFSLLSILIHIINSIFSGVYTSQFLKCKQNKKITIFLWTLIYFMIQVVIFEVIQSRYPFNDVVSVVINVLLLLSMQWIFFRKGDCKVYCKCIKCCIGDGYRKVVGCSDYAGEDCRK